MQIHGIARLGVPEVERNVCDDQQITMPADSTVLQTDQNRWSPYDGRGETVGWEYLFSAVSMMT
jgi:hypothetical protein